MSKIQLANYEQPTEAFIGHEEQTHPNQERRVSTAIVSSTKLFFLGTLLTTLSVPSDDTMVSEVQNKSVIVLNAQVLSVTVLGMSSRK